MRSLKTLLSNQSRLFWTLQTVGWCCYSILGFSAKVGEGGPPKWIFFYLAVGACGFAVTCLLRLGYRYVWNWPTPRMVIAAAGFLLLATLVQMKMFVMILGGFCDD